jgi:uncharacterized protein (TIGR00255 family)
MAVYSMTGYASASAGSPSAGPGSPSENGPSGAPASASAGVLAEARSVNGRFLDLTVKLPDELRGLEPAVRDLVQTAIKRGKVEVRLALPREAEAGWPQPAPEALSRLAHLQDSVQGWLPKAAGLSVNEALHWCNRSAPAPKLDDGALAAVRGCIEGLKAARQREGARLVASLTERTGKLRALAAQAAPLVPAVVQRQQQRFLERWAEALAAAEAAGAGSASAVSREAAQERALNEATAYAIRIDVAEELTRLAAHLDEIDRLLAAGGELGKRLDFLIQELHREANTLGSKSSALELTNVSVEMKVLIEQMREQVQNLE